MTMRPERVAFDALPNGFDVSTVNLHDFFETMVFGPHGDEVACERTKRLSIAKRNHAHYVAQFKSEG